MRARLTAFLCGWMGGPRLYNERFGSISIPGVHQHLQVTELERDLWLQCMQSALNKAGYPDTFKAYVLKQLSYPAERIRQVCARIAQNAV